MSYTLKVTAFKADGATPQGGVTTSMFYHDPTTGIWRQAGPVTTNAAGNCYFSGYIKSPRDLFYITCDYGSWHYVSNTYIMEYRAYAISVTVGAPSPDRISTALSVSSSDLGNNNYKVEGYLTAGGVGVGGKWVYLYEDGAENQGTLTASGGYYAFYPELFGTHPLKVVFRGDATYYGCETATFDLGVGVTPTQITIEAPTQVFAGDQFITQGYLQKYLDYGWFPLVGESVQVTYNGTVLGVATTNDIGKYVVQGSILVAGTYTLTSKFDGTVALAASMSGGGIRVGGDVANGGLGIILALGFLGLLFLGGKK